MDLALNNHFYQPLRLDRIWHKSIFKRSLAGLNSEFSFSQTSWLTKAEELSLPYYLPIAGGRIIGFIPFPRVLVLCEMQSVSTRIWTRVAVSISYDDYHYTTALDKLQWLLCYETKPNQTKSNLNLICITVLHFNLYLCVNSLKCSQNRSLRELIHCRSVTTLSGYL